MTIKRALLAAEDMDNKPARELILEQAADDILRCVVCTCGNYRHHGVDWMPDDSGEGLPRVLEILRSLK